MMSKILFILPLCFFLFNSCKNEGTSENFQEVGTEAQPTPQDASPTEKMKAIAIEESNYLERIRQSFVPLQEEYKKANGKVPGIGEVNIFVDDNYTLMIENNHKGHVYQTKVNLKDLNNQQGGMMLIPDKAAGEFPGLKIFVKEGKPGVQKLKDGKLEKEEKQLEIFLADRTGIERVTPAILQAMNIASGNMPTE